MRVMNDKIHLFLEEKIALVFAGVLFFWLLAKNIGLSIQIGVAAGLLLFSISMCTDKQGYWISFRHLSLYLFLFFMYESIVRIIPALERPIFDAQLLEIDRALFGETPSLLFSPHPLLSEVMSAGYLSYHLYIYGTVLFFLWRRPAYGSFFFRYLFSGFTFGLIGYVCIPAKGPFIAYADLFSVEITGWWLTKWNAFLVSNGSPVYDVFPSLHVLMTLIMLDFDWQHRRVIFWFMLPIVCILLTSTLYLRYHYALDLVAGVVVFLGVRQWIRKE